MPTISVFFGIIIRMYYDDHNPPHFHVYYDKYSAIIHLETLTIMEGSLPNRAFSMVSEWATLHRDELIQNWQKAVLHSPLEQIPPLE
jgi:hypothetical protein